MKNPSVLITLTAKKFCLFGGFLLLVVLSDMLLKSSVFHSSFCGKNPEFPQRYFRYYDQVIIIPKSVPQVVDSQHFFKALNRF